MEGSYPKEISLNGADCFLLAADHFMREKRSRSVLKAVSYRVMGTIATFGLAYLITGNLLIAGKIGLLDFIIKFFVYYLNERIWNLISWGYTLKIEDAKANDHDYLPKNT